MNKISEVNFEIKLVHGKNKTFVVHANRLKPAKISDMEPYIPRVNNDCNNDPDNRHDSEDENEKDSESDASEDEVIVISERDRRQPSVRHPYALRSLGPVESIPRLPERKRRRFVTLVNIILVLVLLKLMSF